MNPIKTIKLRIVFDCAAQHLGVSLNSKVLQGPDLTNKLIGVLTRFRLYQIALMADVEAMFQQVRVEANDQDALRFSWWPREDTDEAPLTYRMTVHLFGGTWSPSCCTYAVHWTVQNNAHQFSKAACEMVNRNFYVDDCLKSVSTVERGDCVNKGVEGPARSRRLQPHEVDEQSSGSLRGDTIARSVQEGQGEEHRCTHGGESLRSLLEYGGRLPRL